MTFLDEKGNIPEAGPSTWQFNFKFNLTEDMYAEDSVDLLQVIGYLHHNLNQESFNTMQIYKKSFEITNLEILDNLHSAQ